MNQGMSKEQKQQLTRERAEAVREALNREKAYVSQAKGTRDWTIDQQRDILAGYHPKDENGKPFEGHHMKSVHISKEHAGNPSNIQWLSHDEHIQCAHNGSTHNPTNGYYNPKTGETESFRGRAPRAPEATELSHPMAKGQGQGHGIGETNAVGQSASYNK
jgi:hypothetical protein